MMLPYELSDAREYVDAGRASEPPRVRPRAALITGGASSSLAMGSPGATWISLRFNLPLASSRCSWSNVACRASVASARGSAGMSTA